MLILSKTLSPLERHLTCYVHVFIGGNLLPAEVTSSFYFTSVLQTEIWETDSRVEVGNKLVQIGLKWDKYGTF